MTSLPLLPQIPTLTGSAAPAAVLLKTTAHADLLKGTGTYFRSHEIGSCPQFPISQQVKVPARRTSLRRAAAVAGETLNCPGCGEPCQQEMNFCPTCGTSLKAISGAVGKIIEDYRRQLSDNPQDANAHYNLALAYLQAGEEHPAEVELRRVLELEPGFADAHVRLAGLYLRRGEKDKAKSQLQRALEAEPDNPAAKRMMESLISNRR